MKAKTYPIAGNHYCYVLTKHGWMNQGMVPDKNRQPFIDGYKKDKGSKVAFLPFCFTDNNLMTDSEIYSYGECIL